MKGYLQKLDTVNFSRDEHSGNELNGMIEEARIMTILYSVFYQPVLAPNQVFDLLLFRSLHENESLDLTPFVLHVDSTVHGMHLPFRAQLALLLRRAGIHAFIFSSVSNAKVKALAWGELVGKASAISTEDLIAEAARDEYYPEIVEWAEKLDKDISRLNVQPFATRANYETLFHEYLQADDRMQGLGFLQFTVPKDRSEAYQQIAGIGKSELTKQQMRQLPDVLSNLQYALGTDSSLIVESDVSVVSNSSASSTLAFARLTIDFEGLFRKYEKVEDAIRNADLRTVSRALARSRRHINAGWAAIKDEQASRGHFAEGLRAFLTSLDSSEVAGSEGLSFGFSYEPSGNPCSFGTAGFRVDMSQGFLQRITRNFRFRGLAKFINLK
jgi:hypothetical protein